MADLVCCIAENDTAVYSTYTPIKKKKKKTQLSISDLHFDNLMASSVTVSL